MQLNNPIEHPDFSRDWCKQCFGTKAKQLVKRSPEAAVKLLVSDAEAFDIIYMHIARTDWKARIAERRNKRN